MSKRVVDFKEIENYYEMNIGEGKTLLANRIKSPQNDASYTAWVPNSNNRA